METLQEINDFIDAQLPSNDEGLITAGIMRNVLKEVIESVWVISAAEGVTPGYKSYQLAAFDGDNSVVITHSLRTTELIEVVSINSIRVGLAHYNFEPVDGDNVRLTLFEPLGASDVLTITYLKVNSIIGNKVSEFIENFDVFYDSGVNRLPNGWALPTHHWLYSYSADHYIAESNGKIRFVHNVADSEDAFVIVITQPLEEGTYSWSIDYTAAAIYSIFAGVGVSLNYTTQIVNQLSGQITGVVEVSDDDYYPGEISLRVKSVDEDIDLLIDNLVLTKIS